MNTTTMQAGVAEHLDTGNIGASGRKIVITKNGEAGGFEIDGFTGIVLNPNELPGWAQGLTNALLGERHIFYQSRLGSLYTEALKSPDTLAYEDITWVHAQLYDEPLEVQPEVRNEAGEVVQQQLLEYVELNQVDADHEFRMQQIAELTGISEDIDLKEGTFANMVSEEIARDDARSEEELAAMEQAKTAGFSTATGTGS